MGKIIKLNPFIRQRVWGGTKLKQYKNLNTDKIVGETWEVSTHKDGESFIGDTGLSELCSLSYLVKFIDTSANLSIQVHPDEAYAQEHEDSKGKTECWLILEAEESAGIYLGFKKGVTRKEFFSAVESGLAVDKFLNFINVKAGDYFYIPAGTIHAIGSGVTLAEIQQNSGVTYRVWDWNRLGLDGKPRELHIAKAKDVINFNDGFNDSVLSYSKRNLLEQVGISTLVEHSDFSCQLFSNMVQKDMEISLNNKDSLILLKGSIDGDIKLSEYESGIVVEKGSFNLTLSSQTSFLIVSQPD